MVNKLKSTATSLDSDNKSACDYTIIQGKHKPNISERSEAVEKATNDCINKIQDDFKAVNQNPIKLEESEMTPLRNIENYVQVVIKEIEENEDKIKKEVEIIYQQRKEFLDVKMQELQAMKSNEATANELYRITSLKKRINEMSRTFDFLKLCHKKNIKHLRAAECLRLKGMEFVTENETIVVRIIKTEECEINAFQIIATWTQPTREYADAQVQEDDNGDYFVTGKFTSSGSHRLDVRADGKQVIHSPMIIKVKKGLLKTIKTKQRYVKDVVKYEVDCLLISFGTNEMFKFKQSGEYIGKLTLPQGVEVNRMYKMINGNIAFSDKGNKCVKICNMNGQLIKSIGEGELESPAGIHVNEQSNVVYVAKDVDCNVENYLFMFNINSGQTIKYMRSQFKEKDQMNAISDFTTTNQGHFLLLESKKQRLQLFDNKGRFMKTLVESGTEDGQLGYPHGVVVDEDDNIIIASNHKLQLFSSDGNFIKRIDKPGDGIKYPVGLSIISHHPRRLAVVNNGDSTLRIFNY